MDQEITFHSAISGLAVTDSVDRYIQQIHRIPVLSLEEEKALALRLYEQEDIEAARQLVLSNLRFVVNVAKGYLGYGLALADLIQEGNIGLMKAVKRFDPRIGVRLISFAVHWIKAEIHEFVIRNWRIVKIATTKAQRKLFFNLRRMKKRLGWFNQAEVDAVAKDLGVSSKDVLEMEQRLNAHDAAFDAPADANEDEDFSPEHYLTSEVIEDPAELIEAKNMSESRESHLQQALESLDERSRDILEKRWLAEKKLTLHDLAAQYKVSAERIRQLENNAMKKLKLAIAA